MSESPATTSTAVPHDEDLHCPLCEYNLRGLEQPRCPECGYQFDWDELRRTTRETHPFLFESHPERNVRSFFATLLHGVRAVHFWKSVKPGHNLAPRRMMLYALIVSLLIVLAGVAWLTPQMVTARQEVDRARASVLQVSGADRAYRRRIIQEFGSVENYLDQLYPRSIPRLTAIALRSESAHIMFALLLVWPWLSMGSLLVFRSTMRHSQVKVVHLLRCVVYSFDWLLWMSVALSAIYIAFDQDYKNLWFVYMPRALFQYAYYGLHVPLPALGACVALMLVTSIKLVVAYRCYLRFPQALLTVVLSQMVVILLVFTLLQLFWGD